MSSANQDKQFIVGYSADNRLSMLGYAGSFSGRGFIGSDLRKYDSITQVEAFDRGKPEHAEFVSFADYAIARDKRRAAYRAK